MSITPKREAAKDKPDSGSPPARPSPSEESPLARSGSPVRQSGEVLFEVPFASAMSDNDLALLARRLNLLTRIEPTNRPGDGALRHDAPGFVRLDHYSGLFVKRGVVEGVWLLEARTWGHPAAQTVHEWLVLAAGAARELDPALTVPERLDPDVREVADRPLGRAANKRLARFRRRLVGLP